MRGPKCRECDERMQGEEVCRDCQGRGCNDCGGTGRQFVCENYYCDVYQQRAGIKPSMAVLPRVSTAEREQNIATIKEAIAGGLDVTFVYRDAKGRETQRTAAPRGWEHTEHRHDWAGGGHLCVRAFCRLRQEERLFAIHRITNLRIESRAASAPTSEIEELGGFKLGDRVEHPAYGAGQVVGFSRTGPSGRIAVNFDTCGRKVFVIGIVKLTASPAGPRKSGRRAGGRASE